MMDNMLLVELQVEELPPQSLKELGDAFADNLYQSLLKQQFVDESVQVISYASPRRLAVQIAAVRSIQPDQINRKKGPSVKIAYKEGQPTLALKSFAQSCGVSIEQLAISHDGKQDIYTHSVYCRGQSLSECLTTLLAEVIKKLTNATLMHWADVDYQFLRPVHGLVALHGSDIVPCELFGLTSTRMTFGHRFLTSKPIVLADAESYQETMKKEGGVLASFTLRRNDIDKQLNDKASQLKAKIAHKDKLLDEVTALVEWPVVLEAGFDKDFLRLPQECLILTMQQNQKYFPLLDKQDKLINRFLLVSNLKTKDVTYIVQGNERVLRARLSDAAFFFDQDQQKTLASRVPLLSAIVYHHRLGNQLERVKRLQAIAIQLATQLGMDNQQASRAAYLAKADLVTNMVGEFPALQGVMGYYYALHDGESQAVAKAIAQHYYPRFAGDILPSEPLGEIIALADKLEVLVGMIGIGCLPTGDKDPFALRRAALGILRMLLTKSIHFRELCQTVYAVFPAGLLAENTLEKVYDFCLERLRNYLANDYAIDSIEAVLALKPNRFDDLIVRLDAIQQFKNLPDAPHLLATNKRVKNILAKCQVKSSKVNPDQLIEPAEQRLLAAVQVTWPIVNRHMASIDYASVLTTILSLKAPIDLFFDQVMVLADDPIVRNNRLSLLANLSDLLNLVADISLLVEEKND